LFSIEDPSKVYLLKKALYRLKQAPRVQHMEIDLFLTESSFLKSNLEATLYVKVEESELLILSLYVDDLLLIGSYFQIIQKFKKVLMQMFQMIDIG
jgi:hypothetical protein